MTDKHNSTMAKAMDLIFSSFSPLPYHCTYNAFFMDLPVPYFVVSPLLACSRHIMEIFIVATLIAEVLFKQLTSV